MRLALPPRALPSPEMATRGAPVLQDVPRLLGPGAIGLTHLLPSQVLLLDVDFLVSAGAASAWRSSSRAMHRSCCCNRELLVLPAFQVNAAESLPPLLDLTSGSAEGGLGVFSGSRAAPEAGDDARVFPQVATHEDAVRAASHGKDLVAEGWAEGRLRQFAEQEFPQVFAATVIPSDAPIGFCQPYDQQTVRSCVGILRSRTCSGASTACLCGW